MLVGRSKNNFGEIGESQNAEVFVCHVEEFGYYSGT
jgi:hypothetical protein